MSENLAAPARRGRPPGRGPQQEKQRKRNRAQIISAAAKVFAVKAYSQATIDDIISAAGISRATFYVHFDSKLALATEIYDGISDSWIKIFDRLITLSPSKTDYKKWVFCLVDLYFDHGYITPLFEQLLLSEETFRQRMKIERDQLIDRLADGGLPGCVAATGSDRAAQLQRARLQLLLQRLDQICGLLTQFGADRPEEADVYADVLVEELLARLY